MNAQPVEHRCPTCRQDVIHLHALTQAIAKLSRASWLHPRLRAELKRCQDARRKALRRYAEHLLEHADEQARAAV